MLSTGQPCADFITSRYITRAGLLSRPEDQRFGRPRSWTRRLDRRKETLDRSPLHRKGSAQAWCRYPGPSLHAFQRAIWRHVHAAHRRRAPGRVTRRISAPARSHPGSMGIWTGISRRTGALQRSAAFGRMFVMPMRPGTVSRRDLGSPVALHRRSSRATSRACRRRSHTSTDSILVDTLDPHDFADQIDRLVRDVGMWRQMARNSYAARRHSTWTNTVGAVETLRDSDLIARGRESSVWSDDRSRIGAQA